MTDSPLARHLNRHPDLAPTAEHESDGTEDLGTFGWMRGKERAVMLELRKKCGQIMAVGYSWIDRVEFDPSGIIRLHIGNGEIIIRGRCLNSEVRPQMRLYNGICRHRVPWLAEASSNKPTESNTVVIESIEW